VTLGRTEPLAKLDIATPAELDAATAALGRAFAALAAAEAQERAARASLSVARTSLAKATIRSPIDGVVLSRSVDEGQTVVSALQAPVLFRLAEDLGRMRLVVDVDEADIGRVEEGQAARFTVAAFPSRTFDAHVVQVRNAARTLENVVTYEAVLEVDNREGELRPGMTGTAQISADTAKDVLTVPNAALRYRPQGAPVTAADTSPRLWVLRGGREVALPVTPGPSDGARTAITGAALAPGDQVVVGVKGSGS
jgi:HlyD family secretion protein